MRDNDAPEQQDFKDYSPVQTMLSILAYGGTIYPVNDLIKLYEFIEKKEASYRSLTSSKDLPPLSLVKVGAKDE